MPQEEYYWLYNSGESPVQVTTEQKKKIAEETKKALDKAIGNHKETYQVLKKEWSNDTNNSNSGTT